MIKRFQKEIGAAVIAAFLFIFFISNSLTVVFGDTDIFKAYCHKDSGAREFTYHFNKAWDAHFENNGTPKSGHELDKYTVEGDRDCDGQTDITPTLTPTPTNIPSATPTDVPNLTATPTDIPTDPTATLTPTPTSVPENPSVTPTNEITPTPTAEITPTPSVYDACTNLDGIQSNIPDGWYQISPDSTFCRQFLYGGAPQGGNSTGQVLGASTLAATGSVSNYFSMIGLMLTGISVYGLSFTAKKTKV